MLTGESFLRETPKEKIARSIQLWDRSATFGQKGCADVFVYFELFNEQQVYSL